MLFLHKVLNNEDTKIAFNLVDTNTINSLDSLIMVYLVSIIVSTVKYDRFNHYLE